jgi:5,10-methylenetetrahydromethanopterin reductase
VELSCAFATSLATPDHIALAEQLGYRRAWCYDSPALYPDVWGVLHLAAARTSTIGIGPGVLVPSLRHPMANAAAIAGLAAMAPGRVAVAIGAGFTGRMVLGQRPMRWADVADYVRALKALLRGQDVEWEGGLLRMMHPEGFGAPRPVDVPILIGADGPKGMAVAAELGDGVFHGGVPQESVSGLTWRALLQFGTVLEEGEDLASDRVRLAAGPGVAVAYHAFLERSGDAVDALPGGAAWRQAVLAVPARERHLAIHDGHLIAPNAIDDQVWPESSALVPALGLNGTAAEVRGKLDALAAQGVSEVAYQPAGPDIPRELRAMAEAAGLG